MHSAWLFNNIKISILVLMPNGGEGHLESFWAAVMPAKQYELMLSRKRGVTHQTA